MTIQFTQYLKVNDASSDPTLLGDIVRHCKDYHQYADASKYTTAHETTHGINNDLRLASGGWQGINGFYLGKDRAIILTEPKIKKSQITEFIPSELRSARYDLYVQGQREWDGKPLYIYDEGVAYVNGAWAAIELKEQEGYVEEFQLRDPGYAKIALGKCAYPNPGWMAEEDHAGNTIVDGEVEFIGYMTAVLLAAAKYAQLDPRLADFSRWLFRHASNAYYRSLTDGFPKFDMQDKLWEAMKSGACFSSQREFLAEKVGYVFPDGEVPEDDPSPEPWFA